MQTHRNQTIFSMHLASLQKTATEQTSFNWLAIGFLGTGRITDVFHGRRTMWEYSRAWNVVVRIPFYTLSEPETVCGMNYLFIYQVYHSEDYYTPYLIVLHSAA